MGHAGESSPSRGWEFGTGKGDGVGSSNAVLGITEPTRWAVLFDMDGTLVDTEPQWQVAQRELAARFGVDWTETDHLSVIGKSMDAVARQLQQRGIDQPVSSIITFLVDHVAEAIRDDVPWLPGADVLLTELAKNGIPCGLVTMAHNPVPEIVAAAAPLNIFRVVVSGDKVTRGKPDPEPYLQAASQLAVDPSCCLAIEDSISGTISAESAGMRVVVVPGFVAVPAAPGRRFVTSLSDLSVPALGNMAAGQELWTSRRSPW